MNRFLLALLVSALLFGRQASAQEPGAATLTPGAADAPQSPAASVEDTRQAGRAATIKGRVIASEGNFAIANARVAARAVGASGASALSTATTDEEGNFQLTNLRLANYHIRVAAPGYISEPPATTATIYRPGETATFRMVKGGAITGRVLNANGDPMALARVRALHVGDAEGRPVPDSGLTRDWTTDDRGIYRVYGLEPGAYVVAATNLTGMFRLAPSRSGTDEGKGGEAAPTYYPSSTLDSAVHVKVNGGDEVRDIDIRYRVERSYAVRGMIVARPAPAGASPSRAYLSIALSHAATGLAVSFAHLLPSGANTTFSFDGVPDGVYELTAQTALGTSDAAVALPQRITVRGANVNNIVLTLTPFASVAGRVMLEPTGTTEAFGACRDARPSSLEEIIISARRGEADKQLPPVASLVPVEAQPDARGEFLLPNMHAGRYSLDVRPPGKFWYVRNIALASASPAAPNVMPLNGFTLKLGERVQGLDIKLAHGAASIAGRVSPPAAGATLPARLRVYAVPVEREHADDVLRYAVTQVQLDGTFAISHLAPGRYRLVVRATADAAAANVDAGRALILGAKTRDTLRRDAERANLPIELQPCQQVADHALRFTP